MVVTADDIYRDGCWWGDWLSVGRADRGPLWAHPADHGGHDGVRPVCLVDRFLFGASPLLLGVLATIWGITVVADSAQFSASVAELAPPEFVGTMLTIQTCAGFLLTLFTVHLIPPLAAAWGWQYAFAVLAVGPFLGVFAMSRLRAHPDATRLAGGRK